MTYDFSEQLGKGEAGYNLFVDFLRRCRPHTQVEKSELREDLGGVDATITLPNGQVKKVQVKTDWKAANTGNVFLETISDEQRGTHGLIYRGNPDYLVIVIPDEQIAYLASMKQVRKVFQERWWRLPRRPVENKGWHTLGVCVPRKDFVDSTHARKYDLRETPDE